jgi:hypothetical protein
VKQATCKACGAALVVDQNVGILAHDELECPAFSDALDVAERAKKTAWHPVTPKLLEFVEDGDGS